MMDFWFWMWINTYLLAVILTLVLAEEEWRGERGWRRAWAVFLIVALWWFGALIMVVAGMADYVYEKITGRSLLADYVYEKITGRSLI